MRNAEFGATGWGQACNIAIYRIAGVDGSEAKSLEKAGTMTRDVLYCSCQEGKRKKSSFVKTAGYKTVSIFGTLLP